MLPKIMLAATTYFNDKDFDGLDEQTISLLSPALEQSKTIKRFANDEHVMPGAKKPSLYEHIVNGLEYAQENIFQPLSSVKGIDEIIKDFNKAFLVHDFGEMLKEFSTFFGRFKNQEDKNFPRDQAERGIAEMVLTSCKLGAEQFQNWISDAQKNSEITMNVVNQLAADLGSKVTGLTDATLALLDSFVEGWMGYFDQSQNQNSLKTSFVGNLVKVVDKLESRDTVRFLHDTEKLKTEDPDFAKAKILNYLKAYKGLRESTEAKQAMNLQAKSPEKAILDHLDQVIRNDFRVDNNVLGRAFKDFESALTQSAGLAA